MSTSIHHEISFKSAPARIYQALTSAKEFSALTGGAPTEIATVPGGAFSAFGGQITGRQVELVPGTRVVQAWRAGSWPEGVYSIARFELKADGKATKLTFDQSGYPQDAETMLEGGWHKMYWEPLKTLA